MIQAVLLTLRTVAEWWARLFVSPWGLPAMVPAWPVWNGAGGNELSEEERERIRQSLWRVRRDLEQLSRDEFLHDVKGLVEELTAHELRRTLRSWVDLIETLAQQAEVYHGSASGRGHHKHRHLKSALLYLLWRSDLKLPRVPRFLDPMIFDLLVDFAISSVVRLINRGDLWCEAPEQPALRARLLRPPATVLGGLVQAASRLLSRIVWAAVLWLNPVSPPMKTVIDEFFRVNPDAVRGSLRASLTLVEFTVNHLRELAVVFDLVATAVLEATHLLETDPSHRRLYARELVLATVEDLVGLPSRGSLGYQLLVAGIDLGVDAATFLFRKRTVSGDQDGEDEDVTAQVATRRFTPIGRSHIVIPQSSGETTARG